MATILTAMHNTRYEAIQAHTEGAQEVIREWLKSELPEGETVDLSEIVEAHAWVLRTPEGHVSLVSAGDFALKFDTVGDEEETPAAALSEEDIKKFYAELNIDITDV